ncbi:glycosyltransferase family 32 protein [Mucilaginibacter auburnensis]|uniref:Glycosyl transferase-like sugar-binding protein n=1 Tax=Mucilaginibacter auburnensis TaxID=1457233 RepID=A0A2H9VTB0_9SPHI|nr:glycosyltransferase [Mucilaginibacter auburnensis]PJJ84051.1 glycosyl transferase-like sugar-binding protein [Mucilaginibacter auburnensis]
MIPKIIHLCWLSGDAYPDDIKKCISTWHEHLPDYEIRVWTNKDLEQLNSTWVTQAYNAKKYAFAADFIRLYALYNYGGIYLDSDIFVYKSFNPLLHLPYFIGEDYTHYFEPAVMGAEKGSVWVKHCLDYYIDRSFIKADGSFDMLPLPGIFYISLKGKMKFNKINAISDFVFKDDVLNIFNYHFFNSRNQLEIVQKPASYCSHMFAGSWVNIKDEQVVKRLLKKYLPKPALLFVFKITSYLSKDNKQFRIDNP